MLKTMLGAVALLIAAPVAAQTAAPADPHAGHAPQHHGTDHGKMNHSNKDCCKDGKHDCCKEMEQSGKKDCCDEAKAKAAASESGHAH